MTMNWLYVIERLQDEAKERYKKIKAGDWSAEHANAQFVVADICGTLANALLDGLNESHKDSRAKPADSSSVGDGEAVGL